MNQFVRDLHLFADGNEIAQGCHICLTAQERMTLQPALHRLEIWELSESSRAVLSGAKVIEIQSGMSVLARGEVIGVFTHREMGKTMTTVIFSPGYSLWQSSVSLSLSAGMKVSDTLRALLAASDINQSVSRSGSDSSGNSTDAYDSISVTVSSISLSAFAAEDRTISRPQTFFGRTCDALMMLAQTLDADIFVDFSGVCVSSASYLAAPARISESEILSVTPVDGSTLILTTTMLGWPLGNRIQVDWKGNTYTGRIISRLIQADNVSGPWKAELEVELSS